MSPVKGALSRRRLLINAGGLALGAGSLPLARPAFAASKTVKIGLVAPQTGQLAIFYKEVPFVLDRIKVDTGGQIAIGGKKVPYEFVIKDSQSNPNRASQVAQDLIFNNQVDLVATFATPETVNPVSDQCEANGMPCIATDCPLESYYFGRGAPKRGFDWTYCFFFSLHEQAPASIDVGQSRDQQGDRGAVAERRRRPRLRLDLSAAPREARL